MPREQKQQSSVPSSRAKSIRGYLHSWYREYEFVTAVYLLEPWEKRIVNSVMAGITLFTLFAAYNYLPHYAASAYDLAFGAGDSE